MTSRRRIPMLLVAAVVLASSACQQWPSIRGGPTNTAFNASESTLSLADAGSVTPQFTAALGQDWEGWQTPVVSGSQIFAPMTGAIGAFDLNGVEGCGGTPTVCQPRWRGDVGGGQVATAATVTGSTVFVTAGSQSGSPGPRLFAFDVRGETGCSGTPRWCQPLWTADAVSWAAPVVVGSTLYATTQDEAIAAFDANGEQGCGGSPRVCSPLWRTWSESLSAVTSPAVAGGILYASTHQGELHAFDAAGLDGCSGTPKVCTPLWVGVTGGGPEFWPTSPVVTTSRVYVAMEVEEDTPGGVVEHHVLAGFPLDGTGCPVDPSSALATCSPVYRGEMSGSNGPIEMAAAYGTIFVQSDEPPGGNRLEAFAEADPACIPGPCPPTWTAPLTGPGSMAAPIVANGVVYVRGGPGALAVDAHGVAGCSGVPRTCTATPFATLPDPRVTGWSVSNGRFLVIDNDDHAASSAHTLRVFGPPSP